MTSKKEICEKIRILCEKAGYEEILNDVIEDYVDRGYPAICKFDNETLFADFEIDLDK